MKIAMIVTSMSRQAGGIHNALRSLSEHLGRSQFKVEVFAGYDAFSEKDRHTWGDTLVHIFPQKGPSALAYQPDLQSALRAANPDLAHLHGLWTYPSVAALRWSGRRRPRVISPHGMLDQWALKNSSWKKRIARKLFEDANLKGAACLHALSVPEREAIWALDLGVPVALVPNGVDLAISDGPVEPAPWAPQVPKGAKILLHLGRIHKKKGLPALLSGFARASPYSRDWHIVIAGWDQGGHEAELKAQAEALGISPRIHFVGPQFGQDQRATLAAADAFVLPSLSEGLPMAVLEAWAFGLPVVMTAECNLPDGFSVDAALEVRPDPGSVSDGLRTLFEMSEADLAAMGGRGRDLAERRFSWHQAAADMAEIYNWALGGGQAPAHLSPIHRFPPNKPKGKLGGP